MNLENVTKIMIGPQKQDEANASLSSSLLTGGILSPANPSPMFPGQQAPWQWPKPWDCGGMVQSEWERRKAWQKKVEFDVLECSSETMELVKRMNADKAASAREELLMAQRESARGFAEGVELAKGAVGARHYFRKALSAGHAIGMRRCWSAILERSLDGEVLSSGKSETLMAASLGSEPDAALLFLSEVGFEPGACLASQAMLGMLSGSAKGLAVERLIVDFGAGSLSVSVIAAVELCQKGLGAEARAKGEAFEIAIASKPSGGAGCGSKRL